MLSVTDDKEFIREVLRFYKQYGRHDLPWRKDGNAYRILVSEIMLQQTQVKRVLPKFTQWMKMYPTLATLGKAKLSDVLILWQGLGYQRRAKALYTIAQTHKKLPVQFDELLTLPSVGTYTASAVCAFAYDTFAHPMLETNIRTALIEAFHQGEEKVHDGMLYDDLTRLLDYKEVKKLGARVWYSALMDYGASLKEQAISHNSKSAHYTKQTPYKGSLRELRAKALFAITKGEALPSDERLGQVLEALTKEKYIIKTKQGYTIL